jgi:hypothetical protein
MMPTIFLWRKISQNYFESGSSEKTIQYEKLIPYVTEKLLDFIKPQGNPYVGQDKIGENKFIINKVKILNHRWIIADFSDGNIWGEVYLNTLSMTMKVFHSKLNNQSLLHAKK